LRKNISKLYSKSFQKKKKQKISKALVSIIDKQHKKVESEFEKSLNVGQIIEISTKVSEGEKERIQKYEGLIIAKKNNSKTITLRRSVEGIGIEQIFFIHSPKIQQIKKKESIKIRRSKLYFLRK
jgi:large subunit ribosomal protein L19